MPEHADARAFKRQQIELFTSLIEPESELLHLPDGRTLSMSVSPHPLGGLIFVYEDVTDRLALERSYNTLIEVQRETLDNLFEAIAVFGSDGRLKLHNPAYRRIWGLSEGDLYGEPHVSDIVEKIRHFYNDAGDWPAMRDGMIARITAEAPWSGSTERSDGSTLQLATMPLPDGNVLLTCLDVSDTARVERALRERNEALETAARLKSEFIANVSYELRTPLNAIIGFAEILTNQYFGTLTPRQLEYSRGILESSQRLSQLINDILDLATIEAGYLELETGSIEICDMLEAVAVLSRERARMQDVTVSVSCPRDIGALDADERRLKQALFNLVSNAIKFTPPGGSIRLEARIDEDAGGDVILAVVDTGIGIAASDQQRVFEKFERGSPRNREAGAGLGLSLVKSLIELHGGRLRSSPGWAREQPSCAVCRPADACRPAGPSRRRPGLAAFARGSIAVSAMPGLRRRSSRRRLLRRHRDRALVVHDPADPRLLLGRKLRDVDRQIGAGRHAALHRRALADLLEPALEMLELVDVLALRLPVDRPRIADHVGDRVLVAGDVAALVQPVVQHAVEPVGLVGEAADGIGLVACFVAEPAEMPAFAELWALIGHLPDDPLR